MPESHSLAPIAESVTSKLSGSRAATSGATVRSAATVTAPRSARRSTNRLLSPVVIDRWIDAVSPLTAGPAAGLDTAEIDTDSTSGRSATSSGDAEMILPDTSRPSCRATAGSCRIESTCAANRALLTASRLTRPANNPPSRHSTPRPKTTCEITVRTRNLRQSSHTHSSGRHIVPPAAIES